MNDTQEISEEDFKKIEILISLIKEKNISNVKELDKAVAEVLKWDNKTYMGVIKNLIDAGIIHFYGDDEKQNIKIYSEKIAELEKKMLEQQIKKEKKQEEPKIELKSFLEKDGKLYEQIFDGKKCSFACFDGQAISYVDYIPISEDCLLYPIEGDAVTTKAVLLPSKASEWETVEKLSEEIKIHIHKYIDVSEDFENYASYYILLSWVYDKLNTLSYLRFLGDTGCGKSRALDVIGRLCYKATLISGALTPAPIYRLIRMWGGTIIIDEGDQKQSDTTNEIIKILNCGFERSRPVIRCRVDDPNDLEFLPTFCPKLIASRYTFYDKALEARCLTEKMQETSRKDIPSILPDDFYREEEELRNKLLMFRFKYWSKIKSDSIQKIELGDIEPRLKQANSSFAVLFSEIPDMMEKFKEFLRKQQAEIIEERAGTLEGYIVAFLSEKNEEIITPKTILEGIGLNFKDLTPSRIGKTLKSLGITTKPVKIEGETKRVLQIDKMLMEKLRRRYIPAEENEERERTSVSNETTVTSVTANKQVTGVTRVTAVTGVKKDIENVLQHYESEEYGLPISNVTRETNVTEKRQEVMKCSFSDCERHTKLKTPLGAPVCSEHLKDNIERVFIASENSELSFENFAAIVIPEADNELLKTGFWVENKAGLRSLN